MLEKYRKLIPDYAHLPLIFCGITQILCYGLTACFQLFDFVDVSIPLDHRIPLQTAWVSVYILSYVHWIAGYVAIARADRRSCRLLCRADLIAKVICAAFFIFMPVTIVRPEIEVTGVFDWLMNLIYTLDKPRNLFPSMHCLFSWLIARDMMSMDRFSPTVKWAGVAFSLMVFASTLFTRQHYIADIFGGVIVAEFARWLSRRLENRIPNGAQ